MNEQNEKPIILVIVTFFLAMTLVYIAFFRTQPWLESSTNSIVPTNMTGDSSLLMSWLLTNIRPLTWNLTTSWVWINQQSASWSVLSWSTFSWSTIPVSGNSLSTVKPNQWWYWWQNNISTVSWIKPRYGSIGMAELLWLPIKEAFVDSWSIKYGYLGTGNLDTLASTVRRLWWNVLAIETENDINRNWLRWDRVLFVNIPRVTFVSLPTEKKLLVAMVVIVGEDRRIIEAKIDRYYASKQTMKQIFEQLYWKKL